MGKYGKIIITEYPFINALYESGLNARTYRDVRLALLEKYGTCYWCNRTVKDYPKTNGQRSKDDLATIDHIVSRFFRKKGEKVPKVLACYKCNSKRAKNEERQIIRSRKQGITHLSPPHL